MNAAWSKPRLINVNPKVFISHANEDKRRFVLGFAERLRERGIDAWVDQWEILPGDSLVDKIFEDGIKAATAIIVIISHFSIEKRWVREELNAAFIKRLEGNCRLIPVILGDCEVPECLRATVWEKIHTFDNYSEALDRIVMAIYGVVKKPPLGSNPHFVSTLGATLPGLGEVDTLVLRISCQIVFDQDIQGHFIKTESIVIAGERLGIPERDIHDSLDILSRHFLIEGTRCTGALNFSRIRVPDSTFVGFLRSNYPDFDLVTRLVCASLVNLKQNSNQGIAHELDRPAVVIDAILGLLEIKKLVDLIRRPRGDISILRISPELKRILQD